MLLVLDRKDMRISYSSSRIVVHCPNQKNNSYAVEQIGMVIVYGNPLAEVAVWRILSYKSIPVIFLSTRGEQQLGLMSSTLAKQLPNRLTQYYCAFDSALSLQIAQYFVTNKLKNYDIPLITLRSEFHLPQQKPYLDDFIQHRNNAINRILTVNSTSELMGIEGSVAAQWFALIENYAPNNWNFSGRNRRPPKDPVNSLLSLAYTLVLSEIQRSLICYGFDPALGFLHQPSPARLSLALDIQELFRSGAEYFVLKWLLENASDIKPLFYYRQDIGCRLSKSGRQLFFSGWANFLNEWPILDEKGYLKTVNLREFLGGTCIRFRLLIKSICPNLKLEDNFGNEVDNDS